MPFKTLQATFPKFTNYHDSERTFRLSALRRVLTGKHYDFLEHAFSEEKNPAGEYIPLRQRRPSVRYRLCGTVVDDSVSMLFSEFHFPEIDCKDENTRTALQQIIKDKKLNELMIIAATTGSVGSVAILFQVIEAKLFFKVMQTEYLTPVFNPKCPDDLLAVIEQYKVKGQSLKDSGYSIKDDDLMGDFWFKREWNDKAEVWFLPKLVSDKADFLIDNDRTIKHDLGFVPLVWIKNLPNAENPDSVDGACTFPDEVIDTSIEIDYLLSQGGRGLKYASDPTLLIKEPAMTNSGEMVRGAANALVVSENGDAKLLEINGTATTALIEYVREIRDYAIESAKGNRINPDKINAGQSGKAMELMNQSLIWLADRLRISYGEGGLIDLLNMIVKASQKINLKHKDGSSVGALTDEKISLKWSNWYQQNDNDKQTQASTLSTLTDKGIMSKETATKTIAASYDIEDVETELSKINKQPKLTQE